MITIKLDAFRITMIILLLLPLLQLKSQNDCGFQMEIGPDINIIQGTSLDIYVLVSQNPTNFESVVWSPMIGLSCDSCLVQNITPNEDICYSLTITDTLGCSLSDTVCIYVEMPNFLNESDQLEKILFFPNPANEKVMVFAENLSISSIDIYDSNGKRALRHKFDSTVQKEIDIKDLSRGIYYCKIHSKNSYVWRVFLKK